MSLHPAFARTAARRHHLDAGNPLRALTMVINSVPGGINLGQGVCDLDTPRALIEGVHACIEEGDRQLYTHYAGLPELRAALFFARPDDVCSMRFQFAVDHPVLDEACRRLRTLAR